MIPRGEVALIVAGIGLSAGYLSPDVFGIGIIMTLFTTVVAPPVLIALYAVKKSGLRHPKAADESSRPFSFKMPSAESADMMCEKLIASFRNDGFFTHVLSYEDSIWQIRRDNVEIGLQRVGEELRFECSPKEESFIATAILEVTADLTNLANELLKPVKTSGVAHLLSESGVAEKQPSDPEILRYMRQFVMVPRLKADKKEEVIRELVEILFEKGLLADPEVAYNAIGEREAVMSTGLEKGIAIPHARTDAAGSLIGIAAVVHGGVKDYVTVDGSVVDIVVLTMSPKNIQTPYLRLIAHIGRMLDETGRKKILAARTEKEMMAVFLP